MKDGIYETLGKAKSIELSRKFGTFSEMLDFSKTRKSAQVAGLVLEGVARDFMREFLPAEFELKSGLIFDRENKRMSLQCDAIIFKGVPLLGYTDVVLVDKEQVKAVIELKTYVDQTDIFGTRRGDKRDPNTGLALEFAQRKKFLPDGANFADTELS
jgi:hypothetical protein